jgi:hypothetical protein
MYFAGRDSNDWFYANEIPTVNPEGRFWNLFACSNARFTEWNFSGGRYVFSTDHGLGSIGSTKTGSMLEFQDWYRPLADGANLNGAFRDWFSARAAGGFNPSERSWFYGMALIGDGTLKPRGNPLAIADATPALPMLQQPPARAILTTTGLATLGDLTVYNALGRAADIANLVPGVYYIRTDRNSPPRRVLFIR